MTKNTDASIGGVPNLPTKTQQNQVIEAAPSAPTNPPSKLSEIQTRLAPAWQWMGDKVGKLFALTDHSSIKGSRVVLRISAFMFIVIFIWAAVFEIDQVIHAQGQVIASARTQVVQAADGGVLSELNVQEGDAVAAGQVVAVLEKGRVLAAYTESMGKVAALRMTVARLNAEIANKPLNLDPSLVKNYPQLAENQLNLYKQRIRAYRDHSSVLEDNVRIAEQELAMNLPLAKLGDVSQADILKLSRAANEARGNKVNQRNKYLQDASAELNKAQEDLNAQEQILADKQQLLEHTDITSPAQGIVKSIRVTTLGGVIRQGDEIMQILPTESDLVIEAKVRPADMAFMSVGLPAKVKLDAYDYSIFGTMKGTVTYISADTLSEDTKTGPMSYYRVKVNIGESEFKGKSAKEIEVRPGMTATVDVKSGARSVLAILLKPLTKTLKESFSER